MFRQSFVFLFTLDFLLLEFAFLSLNAGITHAFAVFCNSSSTVLLNCQWWTIVLGNVDKCTKRFEKLLAAEENSDH